LIIGSKSGTIKFFRRSYSHITEEFAFSLFTTQIIDDIINVLVNEGEKTITQLSFIIPYDKTYLAKQVRELHKNHVIYVSRKSGNEFYYEINYDCLRAAQSVINKEIDKVSQKKK